VTVAAATQRNAPVTSQTTAPQIFWSWLNDVNDNWSTARLGKMPAMAAPLQHILWTLQKLKASSATGDKAGIGANVADMLARIDEGAKTGALSRTDAQTLRRIANSFGRPGIAAPSR
jgi:hypothetical protein